MLCLNSLKLALILMLIGYLTACSQQSSSPTEATSNEPAASPAGEVSSMEAPGSDAVHGDSADDAHIFEGGAHQDHDSKHGGTFFMALDNRHHLEGALERPGVFRLYIYDAFTEPVSMEELQQTDAKVIWGETDGAPEIQLKPSADGSCMEAEAPAPVHFPITLTLLTRLPGTSPNARPELFTFPFSHYSHIDVTPHEH